MRFITCFMLVLLALPTVAVSKDRPKPNVIVIFTDDHGWSDLGVQGIQGDLKTPNLDKLAAGGVRMTNGYVTAPQCVPSRAGLLAGRYQNRFGVESNGRPLKGFNAEKTIAERLKQAGYATGMTGKWHLGPAPQIPEHGFDDVYYKNANRPGWSNFSLDGQDRAPGPEREKGYHLDVNSEAACAFIKRHATEPFFFYCAYRAPHVPLDAPPMYLSRFPGKMPERRRQALAMIAAIDDGVGRIMETLRENRLDDNTLIFVIGDNGAPLKIHKLDAPGGGPGWDGSLNEPMNGEKGMLTEGGIRVPFLVYWKDRIKGGRVYDQPVISLDVAATATSLAGLPEDPKLDGTNLMPYLTGQMSGAPHNTLYWRWVAQSAIREGQWKYLRGGSREYLFNLENDKTERMNLIQKHPDVAKRLRLKLTNWANELTPPGIETKEMSVVWEQYFDFYLDGKPAPPLRDKKSQPKSVERQDKGDTQGWIIRNGSAKTIANSFKVEPNSKLRQKPFLAQAKLKIHGPAKATVRIKTSVAGKVGFAWRLDGQKDFVAGQSVETNVKASSEWQDLEFDLATEETIIHLRLLLPDGDVELQKITVSGQREAGQRKTLDRIWDFTTQ